MRNCFEQRECRSLIVTIACCLTSFLFFSLNYQLKYFEKGRHAIFMEINTKMKSSEISEESKNEFPLCRSNLLDKRDYHYEELARKFCNSSKLIPKNNSRKSCHLLQYTTKHVVTCFDALHQEQITRMHLNVRKISKRSNKLHFVFIGDSRIRQQFYNFLKLIPNYDRDTKPPILLHNSPFFHGDKIEVYSSILRLRISFLWRPTINDSLVGTIKHWTQSEENKRPTLIFLGMATHFMLQMNGASYGLYEERIRELSAILGQLTDFSKVIWLNQYPTVELYGDTDSHNTDVHSRKIHQYNEVTRKILNHQRTIVGGNLDRRLGTMKLDYMVEYAEHFKRPFFNKLTQNCPVHTI
ncbi:uncharacterized protein LOC124200482 isoform X2 [Daphnia pulex]|uniref:uncharacterized protein LOC124200482 isoform X2 n=1 Tax=Daphnia pulex TaxID=6669 RepID=UPI001EDD3511|nr:uncharacterized protein LOC124200482 isoform X2 [Daphnia pulex]